MILDVNVINHNYITKMVLFSLFLFKGNIRNRNEYKNMVYTYIGKRLPWKINLVLELPEIDKVKEREIVLRSVLMDEEHEEESDVYKVKVSYITPLKPVNMDIDLSIDNEKYEKLFNENII